MAIKHLTNDISSVPKSKVELSIYLRYVIGGHCQNADLIQNFAEPNNLMHKPNRQHIRRKTANKPKHRNIYLIKKHTGKIRAKTETKTQPLYIAVLV